VQPPCPGLLRLRGVVVGRRLRAEHDPFEIGIDALDTVLGVLLLALKPLFALRVLLRLAVELLPPLLEIVVGFSRQMRRLRSGRALEVVSAGRPASAGVRADAR
jgi:hypothetical protein